MVPQLSLTFAKLWSLEFIPTSRFLQENKYSIDQLKHVASRLNDN